VYEKTKRANIQVHWNSEYQSRGQTIQEIGKKRTVHRTEGKKEINQTAITAPISTKVGGRRKKNGSKP